MQKRRTDINEKYQKQMIKMTFNRLEELQLEHKGTCVLSYSTHTYLNHNNHKKITKSITNNNVTTQTI